jgi:hypothetical protein
MRQNITIQLIRCLARPTHAASNVERAMIVEFLSAFFSLWDMPDNKFLNLSPPDFNKLGTQMYMLNKWYMAACVRKADDYLCVRIRNYHYFRVRKADDNK